MLLLRAKRNDLFKILVESTLLPTDFSEANSMKSYTIEQVRTPFKFSIEHYTSVENVDQFKALSFPYIEMDRYRQDGPAKGSVSYVEWSKILLYFKQWAKLLQQERDTPDMFLDFKQNAKLFTDKSGSMPDESFTNTEIRDLENHLRQIERKLPELALPSAAQQALTATLKEAPEKASRFTKKEWQSWFIGAIVSQVTNLALSQEHVTAVYFLLKNTFAGLLQLL